MGLAPLTLATSDGQDRELLAYMWYLWSDENELFRAVTPAQRDLPNGYGPRNGVHAHVEAVHHPNVGI